MEHITTYSGEDFAPIAPDVSKIHIEDIAHALSLMCRANGHFVQFFSVAQHSINCANEAKARGLSERVQLACLLHDASEAYLSDITRPVKSHLPDYLAIEKRLQDVIYSKFLGSPLAEEEAVFVNLIDGDMMICEFDALMGKKVFGGIPSLSHNPSFTFRVFAEVENEFIETFTGDKQKQTSCQSQKEQIAEFESDLHGKQKTDVIDCLVQHNVAKLLAEKLYIKRLSTQVDAAIHAYGILITLSKIMEDGEVIEYLSLGAGNTGKAYDVATTKRIAEFKFAKWDDGSNTIRQNGIFKDFLELAVNTESKGKAKQIYCLSAEDVVRFLSTSERSLASVLSRNSARKKYTDIAEDYGTVKVFCNTYKDEVEIIDLGDYINEESEVNVEFDYST